MGVTVVFETHSISEDNEAGVASGWNHSRLSAQGRELAAALGRRRKEDGLDAIFCSDLERAVETARIAFGGTAIPLFHDWRLRECNYGDLNGAARATVHGDRTRYLERRYPGGESWHEAIARVGGALDDLSTRWAGGRVGVIGHVATRWALDHRANGATLAELAGEDFAWREGWKYRLG